MKEFSREYLASGMIFLVDMVEGLVLQGRLQKRNGSLDESLDVSLDGHLQKRDEQQKVPGECCQQYM